MGLNSSVKVSVDNLFCHKWFLTKVFCCMFGESILRPLIENIAAQLHFLLNNLHELRETLRTFVIKFTSQTYFYFHLFLWPWRSKKSKFWMETRPQLNTTNKNIFAKSANIARKIQIQTSRQLRITAKRTSACLKVLFRKVEVSVPWPRPRHSESCYPAWPRRSHSIAWL